MAQDMIRTPNSMAGIMSFSETTGGPALNPKGVLAFAIAFVVVIKLVSLLM